jgi:hypothetical protein
VSVFPWLYGNPKPQATPRELMLQRLREGVPIELAERAAGTSDKTTHPDREIDMALAEGEILLFERARDSGVTGIVRANMRYESKSWNAKVEPAGAGMTLEDYLRD